MKKILLFAGAALAAGVLSSQAQAVYSQNIVGYVNTTLPGGNAYSLISVPLGGASAVDAAMPSIQGGDNVLVWNGAGYDALTYVGPDFDGAGHAWADGDFNGQPSPVITPGQAFYYQNSGTLAITNTFVGNVVLTNSITIPGGNAYTLLASTAPVADALDGTNLALPFQSGDTVLIWTGSGYSALTYVGPDFDGAGHAFADADFVGQPSPVIEVGQGFFYQNSGSSAITWNQNFNVQ